MRRVLSAGSLVAGLALTGASVVGALPLGTTPVVGADPGRSPAPTSVAIGPTPVAPTSPPSIASATGPPATPTLSASPALPGTLWFEDTFSSEGAFWTGSGEYATAAYRDGSYDVRFKPVDLPVLLSAAAGEGSPGPRVRVEAVFRLVSGPADAEYGLAVTDVGGTRHLELAVEADGRYALYRDDVESFSSVLAGTRADVAGRRPMTLRLDIGPDGSKAFIDGLFLGQSDATFTPGGFGIAVRTTSGSARLLVDDYRVWQLGD